MFKKIIKLLCFALLLDISIMGLSSCNKTNNSQENSSINDEMVNSIIQLSLNETNIKLNDYIDVAYFSNQEESSKFQTDSIKTLSLIDKETLNIDNEQYTALTKSITNIFDDLSSEEYDVFKSLAEDDEDVNNMLEMIENDFASDSYESLSTINKKNNIVKLSTGLMTIASILGTQRVCNAAIVAIKGAFNSMISTLKAFFVPNAVKCVIVTTSILVISTVVIVNWNKIKPVFNQIVNVFVNNAKNLASTVINVFNQIKNIAFSSETNTITKAVFNDEVKSNMGKYGLTTSIITSLISQFTGVDINNNNNSNDKTVYLGCVEDMYYKYASNDSNGISFHVSDPVWDSYASKYTTDGLWLVNYAFLNYVIYKKWEIVLVTNPANHYNLYTQTKLTTRMYASELEVLCKFNGASWHYEGPFWRVDKVW